MTNPETNEVFHDDWPHDRITQLFTDLAAGVESDQVRIDHVQVRQVEGDAASDRRVSLNEARELFLSGQADAIQIRYRYEDDAWCDTLKIEPDHVRIIRTPIDLHGSGPGT